MTKSQVIRLNQPIDNGPQAACCQQGTWPIKGCMFVLAPALGYTPKNNAQHENCQRKINKKDPAPRGILHEPSSQQRPQYRGNGSETRPQANRSSTLCGWKEGTNDSQAARCQQRSAYPWIARAAKIRLRPKRSPSDPPTSMRAARKST